MNTCPVEGVKASGVTCQHCVRRNTVSCPHYGRGKIIITTIRLEPCDMFERPHDYE
jgi:hypothetical protein